MRIVSHGIFGEYFITLHDLETILSLDEMADFPIHVIINGEYYTLEKEESNGQI